MYIFRSSHRLLEKLPSKSKKIDRASDNSRTLKMFEILYLSGSSNNKNLCYR